MITSRTDELKMSSELVVIGELGFGVMWQRAHQALSEHGLSEHGLSESDPFSDEPSSDRNKKSNIEEKKNICNSFFFEHLFFLLT